MAEVEIPADFVEFMEYVVEMIDSAEEDDRDLVNMDDGLQTENGYGGKAGDTFEFVYFPEGKDERWTIHLKEPQVRDIADDLVSTMSAEIEPYKRPSATLKKSSKPSQKAAPTGVLALLEERGFVKLRAGARRDTVAPVIERRVFDLLDEPGLNEEDRGEAIADALMEMPDIEDVFASNEELLAALRELE